MATLQDIVNLVAPIYPDVNIGSLAHELSVRNQRRKYGNNQFSGNTIRAIRKRMEGPGNDALSAQFEALIDRYVPDSGSQGSPSPQSLVSAPSAPSTVNAASASDADDAGDFDADIETGARDLYNMMKREWADGTAEEVAEDVAEVLIL